MQADNANCIIEEISVRGRWVNPDGSREIGDDPLENGSSLFVTQMKSPHQLEGFHLSY